MKVGDYVRTKYGISKCIKVIPIRENSFMYEFDREVYEDVVYLTAGELEKYKSNPNIKKLIEKGDYVNGNLVIEKDINNELRYIDLKDRNMKYVKNLDIKSIVTHEQFERMQYNLESEVN